jgi:hypothetical protein
MKLSINGFLKNIQKILRPVKWYDLRKTKPISDVFGLDRGTPIDRFYIEDFLYKNKSLITGNCCEISENIYTKKFGTSSCISEILHHNNDNEKATIVGDLSKIETLPENMIDCFILTQTLNFIYDYESAVKGLYQILNTNGVGLITVSGISQISKYDYDRWGDYWRFTDLSIKKIFESVFGKNNIEVSTYGNVLAATAFLHGVSSEELRNDELLQNDPNFQITIAIKVIKKE